MTLPRAQSRVIAGELCPTPTPPCVGCRCTTRYRRRRHLALSGPPAPDASPAMTTPFHYHLPPDSPDGLAKRVRDSAGIIVNALELIRLAVPGHNPGLDAALQRMGREVTDLIQLAEEVENGDRPDEPTVVGA